MGDVDSLELSVRLSRLRLSLRIKKPPLYPDYENEQAQASSAPSTIRVWSDTDSGFASPALSSSPAPSPSPATPADDELDHLFKPKESPAKNVDRLSVCSSTAAGRRAHPPLFSVNSQDCSSTCSMVSLNTPLQSSASPPQTPPLPPRCHQKCSSPPPPLPPKPEISRYLPE